MRGGINGMETQGIQMMQCSKNKRYYLVCFNFRGFKFSRTVPLFYVFCTDLIFVDFADDIFFASFGGFNFCGFRK